MHILIDIMPEDHEDCVDLGYHILLAHLWGAYAIPVALSGVRRPS